uniref:Immunoglobulin subtype domain-containing protein n=1 Tax=Electrophorus electricus TaxID=8005 RepID=A0AAY5EPQ8_ELEEL
MNFLHLLYITNTMIYFAAGTGAVTTVTGYTEHSVQIRCPYKSWYETRMKCYTLQIKDIPVNSESAKDKKFSLNDDTDGGKYWCGIEGRFHDHYKDILLEVKEGDNFFIL